MTDDLETVYRFARADVGYEPTLGAVILRLVRWNLRPDQKAEFLPGLVHRLTREDLQDLIAALQESLRSLDSAKGPSTDGAVRH